MNNRKWYWWQIANALDKTKADHLARALCLQQTRLDRAAARVLWPFRKLLQWRRGRLLRRFECLSMWSSPEGLLTPRDWERMLGPDWRAQVSPEGVRAISINAARRR